MRGVLKPTPPGHDGYSTITSFEGNGGGYYGNAQYQQQQQQHTPQQQQHTPQQQQPNAWPGVVETPYYPSTATYGTPSAQYGSQYSSQYATPAQPSSASQPTQYQNYDASRNNTYAYSEPAQSTPYGEQHAGASQDPVSPDSSQRKERGHYGLHAQATADTLDDFMVLMQADIDAACVDGVFECCKSELSLGGSAFVPLMRPHIGPYADGGDQDLPAEFKAHFGEDTTKRKENSQEEGEATSPTEPQAQPAGQENETSEPRQEGSTEPQQTTPATESTQNPPATQSVIAKPEEDPLKNCPNATVDCILNISDPDIRAITQRAASRGLVQRIMNLDGFKYMFNNFWSSRVDNDGLRFSYICRDSLQNKDRHAHVPARSTTTPPVHREMSRKTKESWDCKGSISVKFSSTVGAIVVQYRHAAVHPTHAERKRAPRKATVRSTRGPGRPRGSRGTKRKRELEMGRDYGATVPMPLDTPARYPVVTQREPSLFELLQQSAIESAQNEDGGQLGDASRPWWANT